MSKLGFVSEWLTPDWRRGDDIKTGGLFRTDTIWRSCVHHFTVKIYKTPWNLRVFFRFKVARYKFSSFVRKKHKSWCPSVQHVSNHRRIHLGAVIIFTVCSKFGCASLSPILSRFCVKSPNLHLLTLNNLCDCVCVCDRVFPIVDDMGVRFERVWRTHISV